MSNTCEISVENFWFLPFVGEYLGSSRLGGKLYSTRHRVFLPKTFFLLRKGLKRRIEVVFLSFRTAWRTCPTLTRSSRRRSRCWRRPKSRGRWPKRTKHSSQTLPTWQTGVDTHLLLLPPYSNNAHHNHINLYTRAGKNPPSSLLRIFLLSILTYSGVPISWTFWGRTLFLQIVGFFKGVFPKIFIAKTSGELSSWSITLWILYFKKQLVEFLKCGGFRVTHIWSRSFWTNPTWVYFLKPSGAWVFGLKISFAKLELSSPWGFFWRHALKNAWVLKLIRSVEIFQHESQVFG